MLGIPIVDKIIALFNFVAVSAAVGVFVYTSIIAKTPDIDEQLQELKLEQSAMQKSEVKSYKMNKLIVNLISKSQRLRYLDVEINLEPFKDADLEYFEKQSAIIYDVAIDVIGQMSPLDLTSLSGKIILQSRIKKNLNQSFGENKIKRIFFSTFVVQ